MVVVGSGGRARGTIIGSVALVGGNTRVLDRGWVRHRRRSFMDMQAAAGQVEMSRDGWGEAGMGIVYT